MPNLHPSWSRWKTLISSLGRHSMGTMSNLLRSRSPGLPWHPPISKLLRGLSASLVGKCPRRWMSELLEVTPRVFLWTLLFLRYVNAWIKRSNCFAQIHKGSLDREIERESDLMLLKCCKSTTRSGPKIVEISRIWSRFPHMVLLFCCGTKNGDGCKNYNEAKLPRHYDVTTPQIEGFDHATSWTSVSVLMRCH